MIFGKILGVTMLGVVMAPLMVATSQDQKPSKAELLKKDIRSVFKRIYTDPFRDHRNDRRDAVDELFEVADSIREMVLVLSNTGLRDEDDYVRVKSAQALNRIGYKARGAASAQG
jgi:hypothetical protein